MPSFGVRCIGEADSSWGFESWLKALIAGTTPGRTPADAQAELVTSIIGDAVDGDRHGHAQGLPDDEVPLGQLRELVVRLVAVDHGCDDDVLPTHRHPAIEPECASGIEDTGRSERGGAADTTGRQVNLDLGANRLLH